MTTHYIKIALRNMRRFKLQTIVCLTGLAVGMTCFAFGTLWLRFIESFEDFIPDKENVYFVLRGNDLKAKVFDYQTAYRTAQDMRDSIPAVTETCTFVHFLQSGFGSLADRKAFGLEGMAPVAACVSFADSSFFRFFGIKPLEGSAEHFGNGQVVLTRKTATLIFGDKPAVGQPLLYNTNLDFSFNPDAVMTAEGCEVLTVAAVVPDCPLNTQFHYEAIVPIPEGVKDSPAEYFYTFVRLNPKAALDSLVEKPLKLCIHQPLQTTGDVNLHYAYDSVLKLVPVTKLRSDYPGSDVQIATGYVRWFMLIGLLVILCSVANYLITMTSHLRRRGWEFSLRRVLGSSRVHIIYMVSVETLLTFLLATLLAVLLTWLVLPYFYEYSGIELPLDAVALRLATYLLAVILCGMAASALTAFVVMRRTQRNILSSRSLSPALSKGEGVLSEWLFPLLGGLRGAFGIVLQMALSMGIIFALVIILRQVNFLMYSDEIGFRRTDIGVVFGPHEEVRAKIRQSPLVEEVVEDEGIFPRSSWGETNVRATEERTGDDLLVDVTHIDSTLARFLGYKLVAGRLPIARNHIAQAVTKQDVEGFQIEGECYVPLYHEVTRYPHEVCVNEAFCRAQSLTPDNAVGKRFYGHEDYIVSGVFRDAYTLGPVIEPSPMMYESIGDEGVKSNPEALLFRTVPGRTQELCDSIGRWSTACGEKYCTTYNYEREYEQYVQSEQMLIRILFAVGGASLFVCVIGTFSLVSLSLQQRRKEIAIRKVHGATMKAILRLFLKGQIVSLAIAAAIAYPVAYIVMRYWLEGYAKQVGIDWWLIPATFLAIAVVVLTTITLKIWRAAKESTVEALNS